MNDFLQSLVPSADRIGLLRTVDRTCAKHGPFQARIYGYLDHGSEYVQGESECDSCREEADRRGIIKGYAETKDRKSVV